MTGHDVNEPTPDEVERGRAALHELGAEPLPADVLARLDGRLEGELGRPAPVRRRRRLPRLAVAIPGVGAALAAAVVVAVLATHGGSTRPPHESAFSVRAKAASPLAPKATAGNAGGAADSSSALPTPSSSKLPAAPTFALQVRVPSLVGHGMGYVRSETAAHRLRWALAVGSTCPPVPAARVRAQTPRAGAVVPAGTTIRVSIGTCTQASGGG